MRSLLIIVVALCLSAACATSPVISVNEAPPTYTGPLYEYAASEPTNGFRERVLSRLAGGDADGADRARAALAHEADREPPSALVVRARAGDLDAAVELLRLADHPSEERVWLAVTGAEGLAKTYPIAAAHFALPLAGPTAAGRAAAALGLKALHQGGRTEDAGERLGTYLGDPAQRLRGLPSPVLRAVPPQDTVEAESERGWLLLDAGEEPHALKAFARALTLLDSSGEGRCWALAGTARALLKSHKHDEGRDALSQALLSCPSHETSPDLEVLLARVAFAGEDLSTFDHAMELVQARGHDHVVQHGLHVLPLLYRATGDLATVKGLLQRRYRAWPFRDAVGTLAMRVWRDLDAAGAHVRAASLLSPLVDAGYQEKRHRVHGQLAYWYGISLESMGHVEHAAMAHATNVLSQPFSWYGMLSLEAVHNHDPEAAADLRSLAVQPHNERAIQAHWDERPELLDLQDRLEAMAFWGMTDGIVREAKHHHLDQHVGRSIWISSLLASTGAHAAGARFAFGALREQGIRSPTQGQLALWRAAYPRPYEDEVISNASEHQIDPQFIWSLMRVESYYNPVAISRAGARGLMQLMPSTAKYLLWVNGESGKQVDLLDPPTNISMSIGLLARLAKRFDHRKPLMAAAYNAGSGRLKRWLREIPQDHVGRFVEEMPIAEAKNYVRAVTGAWAVYQFLDGCQCLADLSDDLRQLASN